MKLKITNVDIELEGEVANGEVIMHPKKSRRGFAGMSLEKRREIASKGGKAAHEQGTAHRFTSEEAREAGRKGGKTVSRDSNHMAQIGSKGGRSPRKKEQP